jgi:hypothetical protein
MTFNLYKRLRSLFPEPRLQVGTVTAVDIGQATITLPDGSTTTARGAAGLGDQVYIRNGVIEGEAPAMTVVEIEV